MSDSQDSPDFSEASEHGSQKRDRRQTVAWDKAAASKLVMEVEKREQLWNHLHSNYRNFKASRLIWNEIALVIGRSSEDCTNKWASLRSNYRVSRMTHFRLNFSIWYCLFYSRAVCRAEEKYRSRIVTWDFSSGF